MALKYAQFIVELLRAKGMKKSELADLIGVKHEAIYEFLEGDHTPNAGLTKAVENILEINLKPEYYGWKETKKPRPTA